MNMNVYVDEIEKAAIEENINDSKFDVININGNLILDLGKDGIKDLMVELLNEFRLAYKPEVLVEILQDPDFSDIRDVLIVDEVKDLDTEIRLLKEELNEVKSDLVSCEVLVGSYQDYRD